MARALTKQQLSAWKDRIARQGSSGLTVAEFCRRESVSVANFHHWKRKLKVAPKQGMRKSAAAADSVEHPPAFVQVPLPQPGDAAWIEIVTSDGTQIRLPHHDLRALELALSCIATVSGRPGLWQ